MPAALAGGDGGGYGTPRVDTNSLAGVAAASGPGKKKKPNQAPQPKITPSATGQVNVTAPPREAPGAVQEVNKPNPISRQKYLAGDVAYNDYLSQSKRQLADMRAQQYAQTQQQEMDYESQKTMLGQNQERDLAALLEDYAGRGLAQSGLYADAYGDLNQNYSDQFGALDNANTAFSTQLQQALLAAQDSSNVGANDAKRAALERYAASLMGG